MKMDNTIFIVDDAPVNIQKLMLILRDKYKLMVATSGEKAIEMMNNKKPDLVLLDIYMPGINGFDVLRHMKLRKELANIPVIFVTGENEVSTEEKGLSLGAVDYIKKPFIATIIEVKVKNHLELKSHRDNLELLVYKRTKQLEEHAKQLEKLTGQLTSSRDAVIMGMSLMSERHDQVTGNHIERIKIFTKIITDKMLKMYPDKIAPDIASLTVLYSPLHDVGKISISDSILKKTGTLTPDEFEIMKSHTIEGAELLHKTVNFLVDENDEINLRVAIEIAESHHEKFDGTGYPHALAGEDIPISARVVAITDVYDALRSPRPYKKSYTHAETLDIILNGDGRTSPKHFDPMVLDVFRTVGNKFDEVFKNG